MAYQVRFYRGTNGNVIRPGNTDYATCSPICYTLAEAKTWRRVSGDVIVNLETQRICLSDGWLWDWEKADPNSYCHRLIRERLAEIATQAKQN